MRITAKANWENKQSTDFETFIEFPYEISTLEFQGDISDNEGEIIASFEFDKIDEYNLKIMISKANMNLPFGVYDFDIIQLNADSTEYAIIEGKFKVEERYSSD